MAIEKTIIINSDTDQAVKDVNKLTNSLEDLDDEAKKVSKSSESITEVGDGAKKAKNGVSVLSGGFKALGGAMKAAGIGLVIAGFVALGDILGQNQAVIDKAKAAMNFLNIAFNDFTSYITDNFQPAMDRVKKFFDELSFESVGQSIKEGITDRFEEINDVIFNVLKAFKKIKEGDFKGAFDDLKQAGKEVVDVYTGVDGTIDKVVETIKDVVEATKEYTKETFKQAEAIVQLNNASLISVAQNRLLIEQFDVLAEDQRKIRDNDLTGIDDRIKANNRLGEVLLKQQKLMISNANILIASARADVLLNNNIENRVALIDALAEKEGVLAQINGFSAEQEVNRTQLIKERTDLQNSATESDTERALNEKRFLAENITDERLRLDALILLNEEERTIRELDLQNKIDGYNLDTQARQDAETELNDFLQANSQERKSIEIKQAQSRIARERQVHNVITSVTAAAFGAISSILSENEETSKKFAAAAALVNTYQAISEVWKKTSDAPTVATSFAQKVAVSAATALQGFATVKNILKTTSSNVGGGTAQAQSASVSVQAPPQFNVVGNTGTNQIVDAIGQQNQTPIKAIVVASEMTATQEFNTASEETASF